MADLLLNLSEDYFFEPYMYGTNAPILARDHWFRQSLSIFLFTTVGAYLLYFSLSGFNYFFLYDRKILQAEYDKLAKKQPTQMLPNQVKLEILYSCSVFPGMSFLTTIVFMFEVRGYSMLYDNVSDYGWGYLCLSIAMFLFITDMMIYFIHRGLHDVPLLYKYIHKPHHKWIMTTPFASHAFHPVDGFLQGVPYHIFPFLFPLHKILYLCLFVMVNIWTVSIHDSNYQVPLSLKPYINGAAHHTVHHTDFSYNYGQYFTLWDRIGGTFRDPFPILEKKNGSSNNKKKL